MASHKRVGSLSGFWDLFTKLHRSSWLSDVLPSASRLFLNCGLLHTHRQVLGQRIQFQRSIFCAESLAVGPFHGSEKKMVNLEFRIGVQISFSYHRKSFCASGAKRFISISQKMFDL